MTPKFSIVIPSFNQGQYLEDAITSVLDQNYPNVELFVFDGGSRDQSVEVLKKYERHLAGWVSEPDKGQTDAINKGLRRSTGDILAYLNSDDFFLPNAFDFIAQACQAHPQAGLYTGNGLVVDGRKQNPRPYLQEMGFTFESLLRGSCYLLQPSTFINRKAWEKTGEFDDSLHFAMDLDYWLRVGSQFEVVLLNECLSAWRMHEEIKTSNGGMARWVELWRLYRKHTRDQLTPGLLVELFSILQGPQISQQLGMDIRAMAGQCFQKTYGDMQKTLNLRDCIPVGRGTIFKPVAPPGPQPLFRAYPPRRAVEAAAETKSAAAPEEKTLLPVTQPAAMPRVDIVLQATGVHAWAVGGGWENAARQLGAHHRTFRPRAGWGEADVQDDDGLFDYLANPQADVLLLAGFDWHSQMLHRHPRWRKRWLETRARKLLYVQESILNHEKLSGSKVMEQAFRSAADLVDGILYTDLADRALMESAGKPVLFQPFGVDDGLFVRATPFAARRPRAFFRGKHQPFAGQASSYGDRRALIQHLLDHQALDLVPYQASPVAPQDLAADFNRYQIAVNFPSVFANHPTRLYEAMACGCAVVTNRTRIPEIDEQFEHGRHLLYYSNPDELLRAIRKLTADPALAEQIAAQGWQRVKDQHTLQRRLTQALDWLNTLRSNPAPVETPGISPQAAEAGTIVVDGVIFDLQRGRPHGISRVWHRLLEQLARTPLARDIVLLDRDGTAPAIPGIRRRAVGPYNFRRFEDDSLWLQRWCREENAALFISTYHTYAENTPSIIQLHDMIPEILGQDLSQPEWRAKTRAIDKAVAYFAVSKSTLEDFRRLHPQHAARKILLTPNAAGEELRPASESEVRAFCEKHHLHKPYFLLVGNRGLYKNAMLFFRAFALLPDHSRFDIVCAGGAPQLEPAFRPFVRDTRCHVLRLDDGELSAAYSGALALVYPSRYEGFGLPILEAQKCGCPVITCRNSSLAEVAAESVIYVGDSDVTAMRDALVRVQQPDAHRRLAEAGAKNVRRFSWEATGRAMAAAIEEWRQSGLPARPDDPIDTIQRLIFILDEGDAAARRLSVHLRVIVRQYSGFECHDRQRVGAAEAEAARLLSRLPRALRGRISPLPDLDGFIALALGLEAEARKDWRHAWDCYSHALKNAPREATPLFNFRLGLRLARAAANAGDNATAQSVTRQVIEPLQNSLPPAADAALEQAAVLKWSAETQSAAAPSEKSSAPRHPESAAAPLVTAIVSTYKSERFLRGCLEDLEAQTLADRLEIIVVDSQSPQNERAIVQEFQQRYSNIVYIRTPERESVYGAWNRAARAARGKYLTNANTDDRHRADALEILARTLDQNPEVALAYADCLVTTRENETYDTADAIGCYQWLEFNARDLLLKGCFIGPQPMWRRELHAEHGYFDAEMVSAGDYEFWLRLAQNRKFLHVRETLGLYLKSPGSVEHSNRELAAGEIKLARDRYRDSILAGKAPFRPKLAEPRPGVEAPVEGGPGCAPAHAPKAPAVARLGQLQDARGLFGRKSLESAWSATLEAIARRPFHPEAFLLLAEIAGAAGHSKTARQCAQRAHELAPGWRKPREFLKRKLPPSGQHLAQPDPFPMPNPGSRPSLTVCLIVRNEEAFLAKCLQSVRGLARQIVVVDTGSTDRSAGIAKEFGAEVYSFAWCDDFSAARNAALEHATGDWILILDADEELPAAQHDALRADMEKPGVMGFRLPLVNAGQEVEGRSFVPRLFRNAPGIFFSGRIHEQVFPSLLPYCKSWGLATAFGGAQLVHHGYAPELTRQRDKIQRNLRLLRLAVEEQPGDVNLVMNLGLELVRSGDPAAGIERYREAFRLMSAQPPDQVVPELREVLLTQLTCQLYKAREHEEIARVLQSPLAAKGRLTASLHFALGLAQFELRQFSEAAAQMRQCLAKRHQPVHSPINTDILGSAPNHCLALSLAHGGDDAGAERAFRAALSEPGRAAEIKFDYAKFLQARNRPLEALQQLNEVVSADAKNVSAWRLGSEIALGKPEFLEFARDWTAEAAAHVGEDPIAMAHRAEALMLSGQLAGARPLWESVWERSRQPRALAALILCETVESATTHAPEPDQEPAASRCFIDWYRKLVAAGAQAAAARLNEDADKLSRALPGAAKLLAAALAEAGPRQTASPF